MAELAEREVLVTTETAIAEADDVILDRLGPLAERAFRAIAPLQGGSFTLLPADG